jgi:ferrous iron transport protein A
MNAAVITVAEDAADTHRVAPVSLASFRAGERGSVVRVGGKRPLSSLEQRLMELGFVHGERIEILAEARPGRDPFVVRVGCTTLALRRREVESVWVAAEPA